MQAYVIYLMILMKLNETAVIWETLNEFFTQLQIECHLDDDTRSSSFPPFFITHFYTLLPLLYLSPPPLLPSSPPSCTVGSEELIKIILFIGCKYWSVDEFDSFNEMIKLAASFMRKDEMKDEVLLMQGKCFLHHWKEAEKLSLEPLEIYSELYCKHHSIDSEHSNRLKTMILSDIQLFSNFTSPLTTESIIENAINVENEDEMEEQHKKMQEYLKKLIKKNKILEDLLMKENRIKLIANYYPTLEDKSYLKAKCAYLLGKYDEQQQNHQQAERKYLEGLYLIHQLPVYGNHLFPVLFELSSNLLQSFATILLYQSKYKYAILVYDTCGTTLKLRGCMNQYFNLLSKIAPIANENDDYKHALIYYKELLDHYVDSKKINEVFFFLSPPLPFLLSFLLPPSLFSFPSLSLFIPLSFLQGKLGPFTSLPSSFASFLPSFLFLIHSIHHF